VHLPRDHLISPDVATLALSSPRRTSGLRANGLPVPVYSRFQPAEIDFCGKSSERHSAFGDCGGSQPVTTPSLSAP